MNFEKATQVCFDWKFNRKLLNFNSLKRIYISIGLRGFDEPEMEVKM